MPKVVIPMGFDPDLFAEIEKQRGDEPRTAFVNNKLREIVMPDSLPKQPSTTAKRSKEASA